MMDYIPLSSLLIAKASVVLRRSFSSKDYPKSSAQAALKDFPDKNLFTLFVYEAFFLDIESESFKFEPDLFNWLELLYLTAEFDIF